jgi:hypothetical protein
MDGAGVVHSLKTGSGFKLNPVGAITTGLKSLFSGGSLVNTLGPVSNFPQFRSKLMGTPFQDLYGGDPSALFPGMDLEPASAAFDAGGFANLQNLFPSIAALAQNAGGAIDTIGKIFTTGSGIGQNPLIPQYSVTAHACPPKLTKSGHLHGQHVGVKGKCVPNRHMNALNPHALRRATRRLSSFHSFAAKAEKEMAKAFRKGGFHGAKRTSGRCTTCRKTKCSCG